MNSIVVFKEFSLLSFDGKDDLKRFLAEFSQLMTRNAFPLSVIPAVIAVLSALRHLV